MYFEEYRKIRYLEYQNIANVVASILKAAIDGNTFHLWEIQKRAKDSSSLEKKLLARNLLEHPDIEIVIKDLAGCRLIFYSNDDVDKFNNSGILNENFDVDLQESKIHHPVEDDQDVTALYRAHHYLVSLKADRTKLPEYANCSNLKCEIQIQTILNHAWSETGHDVIYKPLKVEGFGTRQHDEIKSRMGRILKEYLLPAGYEFQKVLHDFKRLSEGKELFDRDVLRAIESAADNNERFQILERFHDHVLPNYDDLESVFQTVLQIACTAIELARKTETKPMSTPFGELPGKIFEDVTKSALKTIEFIRHIKPVIIFSKLCDLYVSAKSQKEKEQILKVINKLSEHNMTVWQQHGPAIQTLLAQQLERYSDDQLNQLQPVVIEVCKGILDPEVKGTTSEYGIFTFHIGPVTISDELRNVRKIALEALQRLYKKTDDEEDKKNLISAMSIATRSPAHGKPSDEMLLMILSDTCLIYEFHQTLVKNEHYVILQSLEHNALWIYHRNKPWTQVEEISSGAKNAAQQLILTIEKYRDSLNEDENFVRFKILVGFQSVFAIAWEDPYSGTVTEYAFRSQKISEYVDAINLATAKEWFTFIRSCAKTKSDDLATFPIFVEFLTLLSKKKPDVALIYIKSLDEILGTFLPAFLEGLWQSDRKNEAKVIVDKWIEEGLYLNAITRHYTNTNLCNADELKHALEAAIGVSNVIAAIEIVSACIRHHNEENSAVLTSIFMQALEYLTQKHDAGWVEASWFRIKKTTLFDALDDFQVKTILLNLVCYPCIDYRAEEILSAIAKTYPEAVIHYFNDRIQFKANHTNKNKPYLKRYEDVPYEFSALSKTLAVIPKQAVQIVRTWYVQPSKLFIYTGGRLLAKIFPSFPDNFQAELIALVHTGNLDDIDFVFLILSNYKDESSIHEVCRQILIKIPEDGVRQNEVEVILNSTGLVRGAFGFSEAYKRKKDEIQYWVDDENEFVAKFARMYLENLDRLIANAYRRAEQGVELRKLNCPA